MTVVVICGVMYVCLLCGLFIWQLLCVLCWYTRAVYVSLRMYMCVYGCCVCVQCMLVLICHVVCVVVGIVCILCVCRAHAFCVRVL